MAGRYFHGIPHQKGNIMNNRRGLTAVGDVDYVFLSATPVLANPGNGNGGGHGNNAANQGNNGNGHKGNAGQKRNTVKMAVNRITSSRTLAMLSPATGSEFRADGLSVFTSGDCEKSDERKTAAAGNR